MSGNTCKGGAVVKMDGAGEQNDTHLLDSVQYENQCLSYSLWPKTIEQHVTSEMEGNALLVPKEDSGLG